MPLGVKKVPTLPGEPFARITNGKSLYDAL